MSCNAQLHVEAVVFAYPGGPTVLDGIHLGVEEGERVGVVGPNGSGKTTLFMLLCGLLEPVSGTVTLHGTRVDPRRFNPEITVLFQSPDDQLFSATVRDDVAFGPLNMGLPREEVQRRVARALRQVNLEHKSDAAPHHMSGGEKRLAAFASVLSMLPHVILLDEPTSNLDARNRRNLIGILDGLETSLLIASHDLEFILETCSRVVILDDGRIVADGPSRSLLADAALMNAHHLECPYSLL